MIRPHASKELSHQQCYKLRFMKNLSQEHFELMMIIKKCNQEWISIPFNSQYVNRIVYFFILYYSYESLQALSQSTINAIINLVTYYKGYFIPPICFSYFGKLTNQEVYRYTIYLFSVLKTKIKSDCLYQVIKKQFVLLDFVLTTLMYTFVNFYGSIELFLYQIGIKGYRELKGSIQIMNFKILTNIHNGRVQFKINKMWNTSTKYDLFFKNHKASISIQKINEIKTHKFLQIEIYSPVFQRQQFKQFQQNPQDNDKQLTYVVSILNIQQNQQNCRRQQLENQKKIENQKKHNKVSMAVCRQIINRKIKQISKNQQVQQQQLKKIDAIDHKKNLIRNFFKKKQP